MLKKLLRTIPKYFFLAVFIGFLGSTVFFNHTHTIDSKIIVHSHPFKTDGNGRPFHNHNDTGYLLVLLLNNFIASIALTFAVASVILVLAEELLSKTINIFVFRVCRDSLFLRGPPPVILS
jgi:hypothetical protein